MHTTPDSDPLSKLYSFMASGSLTEAVVELCEFWNNPPDSAA